MERWRAPTVLAWLEVALGMPQYGARCAENVKSGKVKVRFTLTVGVLGELHRTQAPKNTAVCAVCPFASIHFTRITLGHINIIDWWFKWPGAAGAQRPGAGMWAGNNSPDAP